MRRLMMALLVVAATAAPALAQDDKKYDVNIGGGAMFPLGSYKDSFNTGGSFNIGATYFINPMIGIQGEYNYGRMNGPEKAILVSSTPGGLNPSNQLIQSNQQMNNFLFDVVVRPHQPRDRMVGGYVLTGLGLYHRQVQLTSPAVGYTTFCDPYWYVCYPAAVSVDNILGDRSSNDFGINFGGGLTFGHEAKFYIEARYHYVWGPTINQPTAAPAAAATNVSTNASYFPILFGVRF
jgi:opacity protein-like surface antigen